TPSPPPSWTGAATSATTRSSWAPRASTCPRTRWDTSRCCAACASRESTGSTVTCCSPSPMPSTRRPRPGSRAWGSCARSSRTSFHAARARARSMGITIIWDCEISKTPEGYYQVQGGLDYAIAKSLAVAPFADLLWMETKTADLADARRFAEAIHAQFPDKMLAYNLSPSFSWDTTGMSDEEMRRFPEELGKLGCVFNFITYGGH